MFRLLIITWLLLVTTTSISAQEWAKKMFEVTEHDFGTVAKGAKTEFQFKFKNMYAEDVHIFGVRTSCGCTTPTCTTTTVKANQEGVVLARFNTDTFTGSRKATITVTIDKPQRAEVQLNVKGTIRTDVAVTPTPTNVDRASAPEISVSPSPLFLGSTSPGGTLTKLLVVSGKKPFVVTEIKSDDPAFRVKLTDARKRLHTIPVEFSADHRTGHISSKVRVRTDGSTVAHEISVSAQVVKPDGLGGSR